MAWSSHHFLEQCVSRNLHQQYRIVVFGEERYPAYDRGTSLRVFCRTQRRVAVAGGRGFLY
ncbi:hypothetical protein LNQ03_27515 [Klebsiella pneumoniae subsp. pneumoniae]|nr:hypothetical protein [Klebsiella pneumoniae subsp. pneumoniae]